MDEQLYAGLIRDIEVVKGRQSLHEAECALRYKRIEETTKEASAHLEAVAADVRKLVDRGQAAAWSVNWRAWALAGALITSLVGAVAWEGAQLWALEPLRVQHETKK